jgi:hypothetical protein
MTAGTTLARVLYLHHSIKPVVSAHRMGVPHHGQGRVMALRIAKLVTDPADKLEQRVYLLIGAVVHQQLD